MAGALNMQGKLWLAHTSRPSPAPPRRHVLELRVRLVPARQRKCIKFLHARHQTLRFEHGHARGGPRRSVRGIFEIPSRSSARRAASHRIIRLGA